MLSFYKPDRYQICLFTIQVLTQKTINQRFRFIDQKESEIKAS